MTQPKIVLQCQKNHKQHFTSQITITFGMFLILKFISLQFTVSYCCFETCSRCLWQIISISQSLAFLSIANIKINLYHEKFCAINVLITVTPSIIIICLSYQYKISFSRLRFKSYDTKWERRRTWIFVKFLEPQVWFMFAIKLNFRVHFIEVTHR